VAHHLSVTYTWVRGHSGDPLNEAVDELAANPPRNMVAAPTPMLQKMEHILLPKIGSVLLNADPIRTIRGLYALRADVTLLRRAAFPFEPGEFDWTMVASALRPPKKHADRHSCKFRLNILASLLPTQATRNAVGRAPLPAPWCPHCTTQTADTIEHALQCPSHQDPPMTTIEAITVWQDRPNGSASVVLRDELESVPLQLRLAGVLRPRTRCLVQRMLQAGPRATRNFIAKSVDALTSSHLEAWRASCAQANENAAAAAASQPTPPLGAPRTIPWSRPCDMCQREICACAPHTHSANASFCAAETTALLLLRKATRLSAALRICPSRGTRSQPRQTLSPPLVGQ
jgi:hypothetical protein